MLGPLSALALWGLDLRGLDMGEFAAYKAVLGVGLGSIVTLPVALAAMTDRARGSAISRPTGVKRRK